MPFAPSWIAFAPETDRVERDGRISSRHGFLPVGWGRASFSRQRKDFFLKPWKRESVHGPRILHFPGDRTAEIPGKGTSRGTEPPAVQASGLNCSGDPSRILPAHRKELTDLVRELDHFSFSGIHLDLEPDQLPGSEKNGVDCSRPLLIRYGRLKRFPGFLFLFPSIPDISRKSRRDGCERFGRGRGGGDHGNDLFYQRSKRGRAYERHSFFVARAAFPSRCVGGKGTAGDGKLFPERKNGFPVLDSLRRGLCLPLLREW